MDYSFEKKICWMNRTFRCLIFLTLFLLNDFENGVKKFCGDLDESL